MAKKKKNKKSVGPPMATIRLSQCMIVKNEEKNIEKALSWAKPIAFEQIVVDTGSTDRTVEIAEKLGAKVYHFEWINDFSAAKNFAIEQATGNWIAFLDADEYFSTVDAKKLIIFLKRIQNDPVMRENYLALNCALVNVDDNGKPFSILDQERVFRNLPSVRYTKPIHENLEISIDNIVQVDEISIIHTGYSSSALTETDKAKRNAQMLRAELKKKPDDLNLMSYLADSLKISSDEADIAEAEALFNDVLKGPNVITDLKKKAYLYFINKYLGITTKLTDCEELCKKALEEMPNDIDIEYYLAVLYNKKGMSKEALELLKKCEINLMKAGPGDSVDVAANPALLTQQVEIAEKGAAKSSSPEAPQNQPVSSRSQFESEALVLKQLIREMTENGQISEAGKLLEQYTVLNPTDPEISSIKAMMHYEEAPVAKNEIPEQYAMLNEVETIFVLSGLIMKRVGNIDSVLRKMKLMRDSWGYKPKLLICSHNINQKLTEKWLQTTGDNQVALSTDTEVINAYDYFQGSYAQGLENKAVFETANDGMKYVKKAADLYDVLDGDILVRKEYYSGYMGSLRMVCYFKDGVKEKDHCYDDWGYLNYIRSYDEKDKSRYTVEYFTTGGDLCIKASYFIADDESNLESLSVYNAKGKVIKECTDNAELGAFCLEQIMSDKKFYVLVVEDGLMSKAVTTIKGGEKKPTERNYAKAITVHTIFLSDAYNPKSEPQMYYKYLCENHEKFDAVIQLTGEAKDDFGEIFNARDNVFAIPHPYPYDIVKVDFEKRNNKKAIIIARFDTVKQIPLAVEIFSLVARVLPDVKLEIYGRGLDEDRIKAKIAELNIGKNVQLMGYTDDPLAIIQGATMFMMTSWAEGFGLTLAESICNGCPAIAFDIKYGPGEIITDGKTGFLIPRFDVESYAKKMIEYFSDADMQKTMSGNCYTDAPRFGTDKFLENWFNMVSKLHEKGE
ncbi:MAG: glycosyltransferase [Oscillospiraceae bacterium]|nr:glycosyltransferase [Oscillospiraceae bacterium]